MPKLFDEWRGKLKQGLGRRKNKPDKKGTNNAEERVDSSSSLLQPVPHIVAGGHGGPGGRTSMDERRIDSGDRSPQLEPVSVEWRQEGGDGKEVSKERSRPDADASIMEDSGPSQEVEQVHPSSSDPLTPLPTGGPESARALPFQTLYLTILLGNIDTAAPDRGPEDIHPSENTEPNAAADEKKSDWKSTAASSAKSILYLVRDSADFFPPLKSVTGGLCSILKNCEVRFSAYPVAALTRIPAHEGKQGNDRVVGTSDQNSFRPALQARPQ